MTLDLPAGSDPWAALADVHAAHGCQWRRPPSRVPPEVGSRLLDAERYEHGTAERYRFMECRCDSCTAAYNRQQNLYRWQRQQRLTSRRRSG